MFGGRADRQGCGGLLLLLLQPGPFPFSPSSSRLFSSQIVTVALSRGCLHILSLHELP